MCVPLQRNKNCPTTADLFYCSFLLHLLQVCGGLQ